MERAVMIFGGGHPRIEAAAAELRLGGCGREKHGDNRDGGACP